MFGQSDSKARNLIEVTAIVSAKFTNLMGQNSKLLWDFLRGYGEPDQRNRDQNQNRETNKITLEKKKKMKQKARTVLLSNICHINCLET